MTRLSQSAIILATLCASALAAVEPGCDKSLKVLNQLDLDGIKHCKDFQGTITIENMGPAASLNMEGVEHLMGDLLMSGNLELGAFSAPNLKTVDGQVKIENHTILSKVDFPQLTEVKGLTFSVLPALETINFPAGLTKVSNMRIEDTRAPKVDGFKPEIIGNFVLTNNNYMKSFDFSSVKQADELLIVGNNHDMIFDAPNLGTIRTATIINLAQIQLPALATIHSDISFHENEFSSLHMDSLQTIGGTFTIANNNKLTETSFKNLSLINGALSIGNNTQLLAVDGFPSLAAIHGTCDLAGNFEQYKLPSLQDIRGGMRIQTTSSKLTCADLERVLKGGNIVKGTTWSCAASMQEDQMVPTVGQNPANSNGNTAKINLGKDDPKTTKGNKNGNQINQKENASTTSAASTAGHTSLGFVAVAALAYFVL
ncbi:hypothetical protein CU097_010718 [Rhizopus azygosporus]|uniref:Uncharacterized protein n=1 Tax=Rhizopus azygosporus TaxID=86630 RepID=A0A367KE13_RHIAZ|nr:hypothetical protein CU097_010718 [Rhizopus azygosporus]